MAGQQRVQRAKKEAKEGPAATETASQQNKGQALKDEMDDLLDEIDAALEENAEEFVAAYVQRPGQ